MTTPGKQPESGNVYFSHPESTMELSRLLEQDRLVTEGMGGLIAEYDDLSRFHRVLDIACGPGGWAQELATAHPDMEVVGFDISQTMIEYARASVQARTLSNLTFHVMDLQKPLHFDTHSFDLVNSRFINFLPAAAWPKLMGELNRIIRPGGVLRMTESEWWYFSNSPALEHLNALLIRALKAQGDSFSQSGRFTGVLPMLGQFFRESGLINIQQKSHVIDYSSGSPAYEGFRQDARANFKLFQPFIIRMGIATQEELDQCYQHMLSEMASEGFRGLMFPLTIWGEKPS